jgi:hypothetical protein
MDSGRHVRHFLDDDAPIHTPSVVSTQRADRIRRTTPTI